MFQINSNSQSAGDGSDPGFTNDGVIQDKLTGENANQNETTNRPYQWLSYSVTLPQFKNTNFGTSQQTQAENSSMRFTPKFGAAYYPSIKFTIIGYIASPIEQNTAYNQAANNFTLIQGVQAGNSSQITGDLGPVNGTSKIDIQGI